MPGGDIDLFGAFICLLAPLSWAVGSLYARNAPLPSNRCSAPGWRCSRAARCSRSSDTRRASGCNVGEVSARSWVALGFLVVFGSIVAYSSYVWLLRVAPTELVGTYAYVNPVIAVLLGAVFLNEAITSWVLLAGAAIVVSVVLIVRAQTAPKAAPEAESEPL